MWRPSRLQDIERLYEERGGLHYGEGVSQMEHALQCASLAERAGAAPSLVVAALLHDIGHFFENDEDVAENGFDDRHEIAGSAALRVLFDEAVCAPIALHVAAKRYLCFKDTLYRSTLSDASRRSLALQGGPYDAVQAAAFERNPYWREAVTLRRFDDTGKSKEPSDRSFREFVPMMRKMLIER